MRSNSYAARNLALAERQREERAAGLVSERFPAVASVVVTVNYTGGNAVKLLRTINFLPGSPAYFRISCLGEGCDRGGLDLTGVISRMVRGRDRSARGTVRCENRDPAARHADADYDVAITYL